MQCWYCGCDIPYELIEKININQNSVCCERCCAILSGQGNPIEKQNFERGIDLKEIHRQWIFILYRQVYGLLRNSRYMSIIRDKKELKNHQINRLAKKIRTSSLEQNIPNKWLDNPNINRKDFMDYHEYRQRQLFIDEIFKASFLPLFQNSIKFVYDLIVGNYKIADFNGKIQMEIIEDLMKHYGVSVNYYERGTFLYYITIFASGYIYDWIKKSKQNPQQNEDLIEKITKAVILEFSFKEIDNELLNLIINNKRKRFKSKYEIFQLDLIWNQIYRESFLNYANWLTNTILELMDINTDFSNLQGIKRDLAENLSRRNLFRGNSRFPSEFRAKLIIVLSRMIYTIITTQANNMNLKLHQMELKIDAINEIVEILKAGIIAKDQIRDEYLVELFEFQPKVFDYAYQQLRSELKSDMIFAISFKKHLLWLIRIVYGLVSSEFDRQKISRFEYTLINDLRKFDDIGEIIRVPSEDSEDDLNIIGIESEKKSKDLKYAYILSFQKEVIKHIKNLTSQIECTTEQKNIILSESEKILKEHISRAERGDITIRSNANPLTNAAAIIYAVLISNENMPKISGERLSKMVGAANSMVGILYNKWYKGLAQRLDFDFKSAQLGRSREIISLYLFEFLIDTELDLHGLILHLEKFDISKIVLHIREVFIDLENHLAKKEVELFEQFTEREIKVYKVMGTNYADVFDKYFTDLVNIIKFLMISIKSHEIIGADFSAAHFARFLMANTVNLFSVEETFFNAIRKIFNFLKDTKYSNLFPTLTKTEKPGTSRETRIDRKRRDIVGSRIKLYVMKHIYSGKYLDKEEGFAQCPECLEEGFKANTSTPRKRSKEFHHEHGELDEEMEEEYMRYDSNELFALFASDRGNPYFLPDLIKKMEKEKVTLKCGSHHIVIHSPFFNYFKKLMSWKNIPSEFPYQDIFDLPADIIQALVVISIDNFYKTKIKDIDARHVIRLRLINGLKKRFIIDRIYGGVCPVCGEFNTKDHLRTFEYNHLYELSELTTEERKKRKKKKIPQLYKRLSCSEIVREMEKKYHRGGYICRNCHFVIHRNLSNVDMIYDDQNIINAIFNNKKKTIKKFKQNLIHRTKSINDPLKPEKENYESLIKYLFALFEISKKKQGGITRKDMAHYLGNKEYKGVLEKRKFLEQYVRIEAGEKKRATLYYLKPEGEKIVRLMYYFRDYYKNYKK